MVEFDDDDDRGSNASTDNEQDELMEDAEDMEAEAIDGDGDGEDDDNDNDEENGSDEDDSADQPLSQIRRPSLPTTNTSSDDIPTTSQVNGAGPTSHPQPTLTRTSASPRQLSAAPTPRMRFEVRPEALSASLYDIVPTMAAPQSTSINAITATPDMRYWFTGGSDCYVRKYDGVATVNGKTLLTVAQRHPFVDSVVKAGVLMSYWDNEEPVAKTPGEEPQLSPVYSLAVQSQSLWMLSGLESGCINLYSVRHDEGKRIAYMQKHKSQSQFLLWLKMRSSWDKNVFDWDLNTGQVKRSFEGSGGQISAIEVRPASSLLVPEESGEPVVTNGTFSSNNGDKPQVNGALNGMNGANGADGDNDDAQGSPADSLFGGGSDANSLFGETAGDGAPSGGNFGDEDDEFSRAIEMSIDNNETVDANGDLTMGDAPAVDAPAPVQPPEGQANGVQPIETNGIKLEDKPELPAPMIIAETQDAEATSDSTFLAASINGTLRVWDRRQPNAIAKIPTRSGVPPWCMAACWSPDGNYIYAGRRNGTVEEFSLHKGLRNAERTFKFPQGSGAVSAVRAMPNGRHLICASHDILRLYDLKDTAAFKHSTVPFLIVPGPPRAGVISALHIDPTCKYMLSAAGNRGWEGSNTEVLIGYEIGTS
ncbi:Transcription factor [Lachnellula subtilissima]|uniref:Transcription factor n=1 Tax=Lachnellula subtilissima TaxID=602034 RepID=A0A8H8RWL1_9HELO|nr:Transcription factor [Lachnellula subtilissima]